MPTKALVAALTFSTVFLSAAPLHADPIRALLQIQVITRSTQLDVVEPFAAAFPLMVTFDDKVRNQFEDCCLASKQYGNPTFSVPPLPHRTDLSPNIQPFDNHGTDVAWELMEGGTFSHFSHIEVDLSFDPERPGGGLESFELGVFGFESGLASRPALSPSALLSLIRPSADGNPNFFFRTELRNAETGLPEVLFSYQGFATFVSTVEPTPEPASILLLGSAAILLIGRVRQMRI